jgi:23S rRNA pseudouridine2605 synthase
MSDTRKLVNWPFSAVLPQLIKDHTMRLNAYLARAGVASRRGADRLIKDGRVTVNGRHGELNDIVTDSDEVKFDGKPVSSESHRYVLLNKPPRTITTLKDEEHRPTVIDIIKIKERVVPVGRLDTNTTGALLLTNDGDLAHKLMHPSFEIDKVYEAIVDGQITEDKLAKLESGVSIEDGETSPAKARRLADDKIELTIHEGRKHQVKKMLAAVGLDVKKLHRSKYGPLGLTGLRIGESRELTAEEVAQLKR